MICPVNKAEAHGAHRLEKKAKGFVCRRKLSQSAEALCGMEKKCC